MKDPKEYLLDHSKAKIKLLGAYLKRYLNIIANDGYTSKIQVFDLFSGEGIYKNDGEGSPIIILRAIKDLHFINVAKQNTIPSIDCNFNDKDSFKVSVLQKNIATLTLYYPEFGKLNFSSNDYEDEVKQVIQNLSINKKNKAFVFIDPYDYKHIRASDIKKLLENKNSEVLLFLPTQFMYRFDSKGTPEALIDFIDELVEYKNWKENDSVWNFINQLKEGFRNFLGNQYFVDTFTIQKDKATVYCLFFFSSHIRGFEKMLESKWEIDQEEGKGWNFTNNAPTLFADLKTNQLEEKLIEFIKSGKKYNSDVYEFTLRNGFLPKHTTEVFYNWQKSGILKVQSPRDLIIRKNAFYISYDNYKNEPEKVFYNLN